MDNKSGFGKVLVAWYEENRRELPWRDTNDPYLIWISEIILQQTGRGKGRRGTEVLAGFGVL